MSWRARRVGGVRVCLGGEGGSIGGVGGLSVYGVGFGGGGGEAHILRDICPRGLRFSQIAELGLNLSGS